MIKEKNVAKNKKIKHHVVLAYNREDVMLRSLRSPGLGTQDETLKRKFYVLSLCRISRHIVGFFVFVF